VIDHPLYQAQIDLEYDMVTAGRDKFLSTMQKAATRQNESETPYGVLLMKKMHSEVTEAIQAEINAAAMGRPGRRRAHVTYLTYLGADVSAYIALRGILDGISSVRRAQTLALSIARLFQDQVRLDKFMAENPDKYEVTMRQVEKATSYRYKSVVSRLMMNRTGLVDPADWSQTDMAHLGFLLMDLANNVTGLLEKRHIIKGSQQVGVEMIPTDLAREWVAKCKTTFEILSPEYLPTIIPPKPWAGPKNGGYYTGMARRIKFVIKSKAGYNKGLAGKDMAKVYDAVNAIQETPWKVNKPVLDVLLAIWEGERSAKGLPALRDADAPVKACENLKEVDPDAFKVWKRKANKVIQENIAMTSKRKALLSTIQAAKKMSAYEEFYFPHQVDFRGRAYAIPKFLNPQGNDVTKSLLTFAHGIPLGEDGWQYLAIQGANTYGNDKISLEERVQWVLDNQESILRVAADPLGDGFDFWQAAGETWCFLAFCFEWAGYVAEGDAFCSSLPIAMDGSCNGIQHYSAVLRDQVGGAATNLVPSTSGKPSDIYGEVAGRAVEYLTALLRPEVPTSGFLADLIEGWEKVKVDEETGEVLRDSVDYKDMARQWLRFGVDRSISKRSVMTLPYGSSQRSSRDFIDEAIRKKIKEKGVENVFQIDEEDDGIFDAALFLNPLIWQAIGDTVKAAREGMKWLKDCVVLVSKANSPMLWQTPDGFPVEQAYYVQKVTKVKTHIAGEVTVLNLTEDTAEINKREQANGIAPNWVHSMDATAMRGAVRQSVEEGIGYFAMIHDSFGTHAGNSAPFARIIRESFVRLYTDNKPLEDFQRQVLALVTDKDAEKVPAIPAKGTLELDQVLQSDFFFA
jgi:DNA-directed RNA polymerase